MLPLKQIVNNISNFFDIISKFDTLAGANTDLLCLRQ